MERRGPRPLLGGETVPCEAVVSPVRRSRGPGGDGHGGLVVTLTDARGATRRRRRCATRTASSPSALRPTPSRALQPHVPPAGSRPRGRALAPLPQPFTVLMVDLDDFKRVNDLLGHDGATTSCASSRARYAKGSAKATCSPDTEETSSARCCPARRSRAARPVADRLRRGSRRWRRARVAGADRREPRDRDHRRPPPRRRRRRSPPPRRPLHAGRQARGREPLLHRRPGTPDAAETSPVSPVPLEAPPARPTPTA